MTPALAQHRSPRVRDWAEIQEQMLVPLYETAYERLEVGPGSRVLGLGCGSGLALLLAASRGASVIGMDSDAARLEVARERLLPDDRDHRAPQGKAKLVHGEADDLPPEVAPPNLVTAFDALPSSGALARATDSAERGTPVVLAGWGPPERCTAAPVLQMAAGKEEGKPPEKPGRLSGRWTAGGRDGLEELALRSGLRLEGSGRVSCPFEYPDLKSAVRGLLSASPEAGSGDSGAGRGTPAAPGRRPAEKLAEALRPHLREDGSVLMPNLFRYVIARTP